MKKNLIKISLLTALLLLASGCRNSNNPTEQIIEIGGKVVVAQLALHPDDQAKGLAGVERLADNEGMLFIFPDHAIRTFWMKGMLIPIDILWLDNNRIVGFAENVPYPADRQQVTNLPVYTSPQPVDGVLEVRAGFVQKYSITRGEELHYR